MCAGVSLAYDARHTCRRWHETKNSRALGVFPSGSSPQEEKMMRTLISGGTRAFVLGSALLALVSFARTASASQPVITNCPSSVTTDANGNFDFYVEVTNNGYPGDVELHAGGSSGVTVSVTPDHHVFDSEERFNYHVTGHLDGRSGTVSLSLFYSPNAAQTTPTPIKYPKGYIVQIVHG
jgi:hypothetical protein